MWHIAPIVRPILCSNRKLRTIKHKSICARSVQNLTEIVDPSLVRRMPVQINLSILSYSARDQRKWDDGTHADVELPVEQLNECENGAKKSKNVQRNEAHMAHDLYTRHKGNLPEPTAYAEGSGLMSVEMEGHGGEMSGVAIARVQVRSCDWLNANWWVFRLEKNSITPTPTSSTISESNIECCRNSYFDLCSLLFVRRSLLWCVKYEARATTEDQVPRGRGIKNIIDATLVFGQPEKIFRTEGNCN